MLFTQTGFSKAVKHHAGWSVLPIRRNPAGSLGWRTLALVLLIGMGFARTSAGSTPGKLYWSDSGTDRLERSDLDGTNRQTIKSGLQDPFGVAVAVAGNKLYWSEQSDPRRISRSNLDGSGTQTVITFTWPYNINDIAVDEQAGKIYWSSRNDGIARANLDGTQVQTIALSASAGGMTLDTVAKKIYWTESDANRIRRANLDGSAAETLVTTGTLFPAGIHLDVAAGMMYWANSGSSGFNGSIYRARLNGTGVTPLLTTGMSAPYDVDLDPFARKLYWSDMNADRISRSNLDGSGVENVITGLSIPNSIVVLPVPEPATALLMALAGLTVLKRRIRR